MFDTSGTVISRFIRIRGTVQGVGFRPFVYRLAVRLDVKGEVRNDAEGVAIHAAGTQETLDRFALLLKQEAPPLSFIRSLEVSASQICKNAPPDFTIEESAPGGKNEIDIAPDIAVCDACLAEMRDPRDRRFNYAFINCTDCGPRYTIITALPYDRPNTTMAGFRMCPECRAEYENPASRRFHAQPICCPTCGPKLTLLDKKGIPVETADPLAAGIVHLKAGRIVAIKGIGGFHLACRADSDEIVKRLRSRKNREEKPFALMARDRKTAEAIALLKKSDIRLLESPERPIVLAEKKSSPAIGNADGVAPGLPTLGIMLPYSPLHYLLFDKSDIAVLIMTSANLIDEPMVHTNETAATQLGSIADYFLVHDRPIQARTDDSIVRTAAGNPVLLRRGRGFVPDPLPCPCDVQGIVGCGGVLKSTVAVGRGASCYVSQYVGNAENLETLEQLDQIKNHLVGVLGVDPVLYVSDLHPGALSARIAEPRVPLVRVQHHHAHAAACMAENNVSGKAVCVVYDGTGYGEDGTMWGGEIFTGDYHGFTRAGHLKPMLLPGGETGIRHPWRMAVGALFPLLGSRIETLFPEVPGKEKQAVMEMLAQNVACVKTSGMGRLFDALSALLGICLRRTYEGQPAIMLEAAAAAKTAAHLTAYDPFVETTGTGVQLIDGSQILLEALNDFTSGAQPSIVAARFHATIAEATALAAGRIAEKTGTAVVCLTGGCFQNALLLELTAGMLKKNGLTPIVHRLVPPNDESISYGQVAIAGVRRQK
ncbi:MAG: carbamoyltransferase HypF [Chitinispirillaceae bacterium]|jgi:hydrogenase maturation protein HypF